jgi:hypothetical protein
MHITVHLGLLVIGFFCAFLAGLIFRLIQLRILRHQIFQLEKDKLLDHAEILQLQKKIANMGRSITTDSGSTPVVLLKEKDSNLPEKGKNKKAQ